MKKRSVFTYWQNLSILAIILPCVLISSVLIYQIVDLQHTSLQNSATDQAKIRAQTLKAQIQHIALAWQQTLLQSPPSTQPKDLLSSEAVVRFKLYFKAAKSVLLYDRLKQSVASLPIEAEAPLTKEQLDTLLQRVRLLPVEQGFFSQIIDPEKALDGQTMLLATSITLQGAPYLAMLHLDITPLLRQSINSEHQSLSLLPPAETASVHSAQQHITRASSDFKLAGQQYTVYYAEKFDDISAPAIQAGVSVVLLGIAVLVPSILITMYYARKLLLPLKSISYLVRQYASGNFSAEIAETPFAELDDLQAFLKDMAHKVSHSKEQLEVKVHERATELEMANAELLRVLASVEEMQEQAIASEKMSSLGRLVAGIAHEINTPVGVAVTASTSLQVFLKNLRNKSENKSLTRGDLVSFIDAATESSNLLISNLQRAAALVHNFKEVAVDQSTEGLRRYNLKSYLNEVLSTITPRFKDYQIDVIVEIDADINLYSYPGAMAQIITNLYENAVVHGFKTYQSHMIKITALTLSKDLIEIRFQDDGSGMSDEVRKKIFEPFFTTSRSSGASGLGMHIVFNLITQKLAGQVELGHPSIGVEFIIHIPSKLPKA